ncbi:MAG TPA: hypothetical protein VH396_10295 [Chitinophagaceae bacterium]|jgi:hypothetical protein
MNADIRETLPAKESFHEIIRSLYQKKDPVNILYDDNGLTRANGYIKYLNENELSYLILDNNARININSIVAVNGIFASDYSEC